ncbi:MAG: hypothetical protein AB1758_28375 [Candidatus Eremiobacterota bacterium]
MEELLDRSELQRPLRRALRRFGQEQWDPALLHNPLFSDLLVQEVHAEPNLLPRLRAELYAALAGPGPGGIQALGWMVKNGLARADVVLSFVSRLPIGMPDEGALREPETLEVAEALLTLEDLRRPLKVAVAIQLLSSSLLSPRGRSALLQRLLSATWMHASDRRSVLVWALGGELPEEVCAAFSQLPGPPGELIRPALTGLVAQGEDPTAVIRLGLERMGAWDDPIPGLMGLMDVLEGAGTAVQAALRRQLLDLAVRHELSSIRRRAYAIGEKLEGESFMRLAVRDADSSIRAWAVSRIRPRVGTGG